MSHEFWFKPKSYGYGATPVTWQGWALVIAHLVIVVFAAVQIASGKTPLSHAIVWIAVMVIVTVPVVIISKKKTDGPWGWHWGPRTDVREGS